MTQSLRPKRLLNLQREVRGEALRGRVLVSVVLIARDEEEHLPRCLASVDELACEIILHDTGSTDRTMEIAREYGARVFQEAWTGDFSHHRNAALEQARGEILVVIDADEEIVDTDLAENRARLEQGHFIRPWMFWHDRDQVQMVLDTLLGKRRMVAAPARTESIDDDVEQQTQGGVQ